MKVSFTVLYHFYLQLFNIKARNCVGGFFMYEYSALILIFKNLTVKKIKTSYT